MMNSHLRNNFEKILYSTPVHDNMPDEVISQNLNSITDWIIDNIPEKIYRFRRFSQNSIVALEKDEIWGGIASTFNDPFECIPTVDMAKALLYYEDMFKPTNIRKIIKEFKSGDFSEATLRAHSKKYLNELKHKFANATSKQIATFVRDNKPRLLQYIANNIEEHKMSFFKNVFEYEHCRNIACFSENLNSTLMWGHYANSHTGFALEYNMKKYIQKCDSCGKVCSNLRMNYPFAPVMYSDKRVDATPYFIRVQQADIIEKLKIPMDYIPIDDKILPTKWILTKSTDWAYEKEWRMFSKITVDDVIKKYKIIAENIIPEAVYVGALASKEDTELITDICKIKNIPLHKMQMPFMSDSFSIISELDSKE